MKLRQSYKGYIIEAMTFELRGDLGFSSEFYVEKCDGEGVTATRFVMPGIYQDGQRAIQACMQAGRQKIDAGYSTGV